MEITMNNEIQQITKQYERNIDIHGKGYKYIPGLPKENDHGMNTY